jgi:hypothetical protein
VEERESHGPAHLLRIGARQIERTQQGIGVPCERLDVSSTTGKADQVAPSAARIVIGTVTNATAVDEERRRLRIGLPASC